MKQQAMQELKLLEAQYPTRFHYLKLQLKEFINHLDEDDPQSLKHKHQQFHPSIITQESSSSRKRWREEEKDDGYSKPKPKPKIRRKKGVCDAIHKAEACLRKIRTLKSLFCSSDH
ncbi:hypothetical protein R6Q59_003336 [Mikania micrantha]|uniref:Uncharacterized protein n=1 Tax=Mikania micrantha TaxID=192012 RepID=A0A5N6LL97_9ASTR|nr:hypothetical protein E3N88_41523 [Mikania micrantha]